MQCSINCSETVIVSVVFGMCTQIGLAQLSQVVRLADNPLQPTTADLQRALRAAGQSIEEDLPGSWVFGSLDWAKGEDVLLSLDAGGSSMEVFWVRGTLDDVDSLIETLLFADDGQNLIRDGEQVIGINMANWLRTNSVDSFRTSYGSVQIPSMANESNSDGVSTTNTSAIWFKLPEEFVENTWVSAMKQDTTVLLEAEQGSVSVHYTVILPQYFVNRADDAELLTRVILGDQSPCHLDSDGSQLADCSPLLETLQKSGMLNMDPDGPGAFPEADLDCEEEWAIGVFIERAARDGDRSRCGQSHSRWTAGAVVAAIGCCAGGAILCPPHGCAIGVVGCGVAGAGGVGSSYYFCLRAANDDYRARMFERHLTYFQCCNDFGGCNANHGP